MCFFKGVNCLVNGALLTYPLDKPGLSKQITPDANGGNLDNG